MSWIPTPRQAFERVRTEASERLAPGSRSRAAAKATLETARIARSAATQVRGAFTASGAIPVPSPSTRSWLAQMAASRDALRAQHEHSLAASDPVTFLVVVVPQAGAGVDAVDASIDSVLAQSWTQRDVVVCGDVAPTTSSTEAEHLRTAGAHWTEDATGAAVVSGADYVIFLPAGDALTPDALFQVAGAAWENPLLDVVTWDEARVARGEEPSVRLRPSWSPEALLGANYIGAAFAMRRSLLIALGGLTPLTTDAALWDLLVRSTAIGPVSDRVTRPLSRVVHHHDTVSLEAATAIREHLERIGRPAQVSAARDSLRITPTPASWPSVSVVIPTRHNRPLLGRALASLRRTEYAGAWDVHVIDNGGQSAENDAWYDEQRTTLERELSVTWWTESPFNYSRVNNVAARSADGEVIVFLNDDTEIANPHWLDELVGWAVQPEIGCVGGQLLDADGMIQHGGVVLGLGGFADHLFQGMAPGSDSLLGATDRYRNTLSVTGACLAIRRDVFEELGGFDERFVLCGSDVTLGLDAVLSGRRNVCSPHVGVRHLESATRGSTVPPEDFFASYWRYNPWVLGGDPYFSPLLSLTSRTPRLRGDAEPSARQMLSEPLGRNLTIFRQANDENEAIMLADLCRADSTDRARLEAVHAATAGHREVRTVNWFIPDIDSPYYGGINTAFRLADYLRREHGVVNRFIVWGAPHDLYVRSAVAAAFPGLADSEIVFHDGSAAALDAVPEADASIATLWVTAYFVAKSNSAPRRFYLIQDFEPMFYPAGSLYALTEESYRLGLYGICNTENLHKIYRDDYSGKGTSFMPAVDRKVFHDAPEPRPSDRAVTIFLYGRPGHWRNCWEIAQLALGEIKQKYGKGVRIVAAGSWARGTSRVGDIQQLGLLDYRATGVLYRTVDIGLALTVSKHPSYLPLELMASGVPVVAFDNPWGHWILDDERNSLLAELGVAGIVEQLSRLVDSASLRHQLAAQATADIDARHSDWDGAFSGLYAYLCNPEAS
jgi:GT2 family glycosyltransferase/glycosyltransferase involved in cell wall biosynthesis